MRILQAPRGSLHHVPQTCPRERAMPELSVAQETSPRQGGALMLCLEHVSVCGSFVPPSLAVCASSCLLAHEPRVVLTLMP